MSEYLGEQQHFLIGLNETYDEMAFAGEKVQMASQRTIRVDRPDKMAVDSKTAAGDRKRVVCNGKDVTIIDETRNTYGVIPAGGSLGSVLDTLGKDYGMAAPGSDLLYSNLYAKLLPKLKTGQFLGTDTIEGHKCNHFTFTQADLSWQIWMDQGDKPVPRQLVIRYDNVPGRPKYTIVVTKWDTSPEPPSEFKTRIPKGATLVSVMSLEGQVVAAPQP